MCIAEDEPNSKERSMCGLSHIPKTRLRCLLIDQVQWTLGGDNVDREGAMSSRRH